MGRGTGHIVLVSVLLCVIERVCAHAHVCIRRFLCVFLVSSCRPLVGQKALDGPSKVQRKNPARVRRSPENACGASRSLARRAGLLFSVATSRRGRDDGVRRDRQREGARRRENEQERIADRCSPLPLPAIGCCASLYDLFIIHDAPSPAATSMATSPHTAHIPFRSLSLPCLHPPPLCRSLALFVDFVCALRSTASDGPCTTSSSPMALLGVRERGVGHIRARTRASIAPLGHARCSDTNTPSAAVRDREASDACHAL